MRSHRAPEVAGIEHIVDRLTKSIGENAAGQRILGEANRIRNGAIALDNAYMSRSPTETAAAHTKRIGQMARKFDQETTASLNRAIAAHQAGLQDAQRRIDDKVNLKPHPYAEGICARFWNLSHKARMELLDQLIAENRGDELAAITRAPRSLTGLAKEHQQAFELAIISKHAAAELAEQQALNEAMQSFTAVSRAQSSFTKSLTDPAELERIERSEAAASEAGAAFDEVFAPQ